MTSIPAWAPAGDYTDIRYETAEGIAKITINRPEVRNAFRPLTVKELKRAFDVARDDPTIGVIVLTGQGPLAFCSGRPARFAGPRCPPVQAARVRGSRWSLGNARTGRSGSRT